MAFMRAILRKLGFGKIRQILKKISLQGKKTEDVFTEIYRKNKWGDAESVSGPGSTLKETEHLRAELKKIFEDYKIRTLIDLPCGDFNWFREIDYPFERYIGCDIVDALVEENNKRYAGPDRIFKKADVLRDRLDDADALLARDLLIHFSNEDIFRFFHNIRRANITWLLTSHFVKTEKNNDIATGQGRLINLTLEPFFIPQPAHFFLERSQVYGGQWHDTKALGLWRLADVYAALDQNPAFQRQGARAA